LKISFHVLHPSLVLYSLLFSPVPEAITIAVFASHACTPRKSSVAPSVAASGTAHFSQCAPPSVVFSTVPPVPLAQATVPSTESMPRRPAVVPDSCICQTVCVARGNCGCGGTGDCAAATPVTAMTNKLIRRKLMACSIGSKPAVVHTGIACWRSLCGNQRTAINKINP